MISAWAAPPSRLGETLAFYTHIPDAEIEAVTRYVGVHLVIHVDKAHTALLADAQVRQLGQAFDQTIYAKTQATIGSEWSPGIDLDPRVHLLIHDVEANGSSQGFGGYFSQVDEDPTAFHSNRREMIYVDVFGMLDWGTTKLFATVGHEFGHLAHWYQNGGRTDESWLEEGMASFLEWVIYGNIHWIFVDGFFASPSLSLTTSASFDNRYGASFLLLLYLYERYGGIDTIRAVSASDRPGLAGIQGVLDARQISLTVPQLVHEWMLANLVGGYRNLPANKQIAANAVPRLSSYPGQWTDTLVDWEVGMLRLWSLPASYTLEFSSQTEGDAFVALADATPQARPELLPVIPNRTQTWEFLNQTPGDRFLLVLMPTGGDFKIAVAPNGGANPPEIHPYQWDRGPAAATALLSPSWFEAGPSLIAGAVEPEGFLQTTNSYYRLYALGDQLYAVGKWGLEEYGVDAGEFRKIRSIPVSWDVEDLVTVGNRVYLATGDRGVSIVDAQTWQTVRRFAQGGYAHEMRLVGNLLLVLDLSQGLTIWDVQIPDRPQHVSTYHPKDQGYAFEVVGNYAYLCTLEQMFVLDLSDPSRPTLAGQLGLGGYQLRYLAPYLFLLTEGNVREIDISDPTRPSSRSLLTTPGFAQSITDDGEWLYVADGISGMSTYRMTNTEPILVDRQTFVGEILDILPYAGTLLLVNQDSGIELLPRNAQEPRLHYATSGIPRSMAGQRTHLFVGSESGRLSRLGTEADPPVLSFSQDLSDGAITSLFEHDGLLYVGTDTGHLLVWDEEARKSRSEIFLGAPVTNIVFDNGELWVVAGSVNVFDVLEAPGLQRLRAIQLSDNVKEVVLDDGRAYVAAFQDGVYVIDRETGDRIAGIPAQANALALTSSYLCIADGIGEFQMYKLDQLGTPAASIALGAEPVDITIRGELAYVLTHTSLLIIDLTEAQIKQRTGDFVWAECMIIQGDHLWIADRYGLHRYGLPATGGPSAVEQEPADVYQGLEPTQPPLPLLTIRPCFPNPANPEVWFPYELSEPAMVRITIYDSLGRQVRTLDLGSQPAGSYQTRQTAAHWNGRNEQGNLVGSGVYFYQIEAGNRRRTGKLAMRR